MDNTVVYFVLAIAVFATAINTFLIMRISRILQTVPALSSKKIALPVGSKLPSFKGVSLHDGRPVTNDAIAAEPSVFVFISSRCPTCKEKIPDLIAIANAAPILGINLLIVGMDSEREMKRLLAETPLLRFCLILKKQSNRRLNPIIAAPFYIFVDENNTVKASDYIGDDNWLNFLEQIQGAHPQYAAKSQ